MVAAAYSGWYIVLALASAAVALVVLVAAIVVTAAARLGDRAAQTARGLDTVRAQTTSLTDGIDMFNDSADRILRTLRKVAGGK